jgi:hypothetical protein
VDDVWHEIRIADILAGWPTRLNVRFPPKADIHLLPLNPPESRMAAFTASMIDRDALRRVAPT